MAAQGHRTVRATQACGGRARLAVGFLSHHTAFSLPDISPGIPAHICRKPRSTFKAKFSPQGQALALQGEAFCPQRMLWLSEAKFSPSTGRLWPWQGTTCVLLLTYATTLFVAGNTSSVWQSRLPATAFTRTPSLLMYQP